MNAPQTTSVLGTLVGFIAGMLATKFPIFDLTTWTAIAGGLATAIAAVVGYLTRGTALADSVGKMEGVTVVAPKALADALPDNNDVVSSTDVKVVNK